jgi:diguanylate cyclase
MMTEVLPLRSASSSPPDDCATRPVTHEVLQSFRVMFAHADVGAEHASLDADLSRHAVTLAQARGLSATMQLGAPVIAACRAAAAAVVRRHELRYREIASLVTIVREAVDSLSAGHTSSAEALGESTTRLEGMQQVTEFSRIKQLLAAEVVTLRRIAADREREYTRTIESLREQVSRAESQLTVAREEARLDPLTDVANRRAFDAALSERLAAADPTSQLVLAMFDVDGFKRVNDELGHPTGDEILQHIARSIRSLVRQDDIVARIGGDEFALIASGLTVSQAESRLRDIVNRIAGEPIGEHCVTVSLSCGVSEYSAGDTAPTLISRTDAALNDAKSLGKNRVVARHAPYIRTLLRRR